MVTDHWSGFVAVINMWLLFLQHDGKSWFGGLSDSPALLPCLSEPCKAKAGGPQVIAQLKSSSISSSDKIGYFRFLNLITWVKFDNEECAADTGDNGTCYTRC